MHFCWQSHTISVSVTVIVSNVANLHIPTGTEPDNSLFMPKFIATAFDKLEYSFGMDPVRKFPWTCKISKFSSRPKVEGKDPEK